MNAFRILEIGLRAALQRRHDPRRRAETPHHAWVLVAVTIGSSAVACDAGGGITEPPDGDDRTAEDVMLDRPLGPTDRNLFLRSFYPAATTRPPAPKRSLGETEVREKLVAYANADPGMTTGEVLAVFDGALAQQKIPSPSLRAALAALTGTVGEPAIDFVLHAQMPSGLPAIVGAIFCSPTDLEVATNIAEARIFENNGQMLICFNDRYEGENPFLLTSTMAHEPGHMDLARSHNEEVVLMSVDSHIYLTQLGFHPELAAEPTELAQILNTRALARLNSGVGTELGLLHSNGAIIPDSESPFTTFVEFALANVPPGLAATPGNAYLAQVLARLQQPGRMTCSAAEYNELLLQCMNENSGGFSAEDGVAAAVALRLDTGG